MHKYNVKREMDQEVVTGVVSGLSPCPFGQGPAPQPSPIACAVKCHWYTNVTVPEKGVIESGGDLIF